MRIILNEEPWVGVTELADHLGVRRETIYGWKRDHPDFPYLPMPGKMAFRISEVTAWLRKRAEKEKED